MSLKFTKNKTSPICYIKISYGYSQVGSFLRFGNSQDSTSIVHIFYFILMKCTHFSILGKICIGIFRYTNPTMIHVFFYKKVTNHLLFWNREWLINKGVMSWSCCVRVTNHLQVCCSLCMNHLSFQSNSMLKKKNFTFLLFSKPFFLI